MSNINDAHDPSDRYVVTSPSRLGRHDGEAYDADILLLCLRTMQGTS
jgi:hypothetical protein